jgi:hypothetical protein
MEAIPDNTLINLMKESKMGIPKKWANQNFTASTPVFTHEYRIDQTST